MAFYNTIQRIAKDSNDNIILFYNVKGDLFYRRFLQEHGWDKPQHVLSSVRQSNVNIRVDEEDNIYGIISDNFNSIYYLFQEDKKTITAKELFKHNEIIGKEIPKASLIKYPRIKKFNNNLLITYYTQSSEKHMWALCSHYYNSKSNEWQHLEKLPVRALPLVQPYGEFIYNGFPYLVYLSNINRKEELFIKKLLTDEEDNQLLQITDSNKQKLYLDYYLDGSTLLLTWSEFVNENLIVKFMRYDLHNNKRLNKIQNLSSPSNCSYPSLIMVGDTLWCTWSQLNKVYSCYSRDSGKSWSKPKMKSEATEKYIRFEYATNPIATQKYTLNQSFGITKPLKFIGFY